MMTPEEIRAEKSALRYAAEGGNPRPDRDKVREAMAWTINRLRETMAFTDGDLPADGDANGIHWRVCGDGVQIHTRPSWSEIEEDE